MNRRNLTLKKLEIGKVYSVAVQLKTNFILANDIKFIKVTAKGYNFLNEETSKCVFKQHFYPMRTDPTMFFIYKRIQITNK